MYTFLAQVFTILLPFGAGDSLHPIECESELFETAFDTNVHVEALCRKCLNLAYTTQNRSEADRIIDKKWHLIRKYGGDSEWTMKKPKGMHHKTFDRIRDEISKLDEMATLKIAEMFGFPGI
jgi:hypothetical protein